MFNTIYHDVFPSLQPPLSEKVDLIFRQQIQPWHPSSTLVHEAGLAVLKVAPDKFWLFSAALFDKQTDYFDVNVVNETRNSTYQRLAKLAAGVGVDEGKLMHMLTVADKPAQDGSLNIGNEVTNDLKVLVKVNRLVGVHVTPTVIFNGVVENSISSSFTKDQWLEWLEKNVT
ncbi:MAG: hypothetical protein M1816_008235 [Peltula sp. TS41687]|nr:MAG: hypothetical protein M1816_008235 [Peltula sp. TS41687]